MTVQDPIQPSQNSHKAVFTPQTTKYVSKAMSKPHITTAMLHPKYWGNWAVMWLLKFIVLFPYPVFMLFGRAIGRLSMLFAKSRVHITSRNFDLAFPEKSKEEKEKFVKEQFANMGMALFETAMAWYWPDWRLKRLVHIDENELAKAKALAAENKGTVVLTCHFVTLELMARIYGTLIKPGVGVYRPNDNPVLEYMQVKGRTRSNLYLVDRKDVRPIVKALMKGLPIWYAPDQDYGVHLPHVFAPFFAVKEACTVTGTSGFAKIRNTVVQPSYTIRLPKFKGYKLVIKDVLTGYPIGDDLEDATTINKIVENMIEEAPTQYMWVHRRFKTHPDGVTDRYE